MFLLTLATSVTGYVLNKKKKDDGETNLNMEDKFNFGCCKADNLLFFLRVPKNPIQLVWQPVMGALFGALMCDYFRADWIEETLFSYWAYTPIVCLLLAPMSYSLFCDGPSETDHFTNTRSSSFFMSRYQIPMLLAFADLCL